MLSRKEAIQKIILRHGPEAIYIAPTGFLSRAIYDINPSNENVFYMQGSMGLAPAIGLGMCLYTDKDVVVINGDASHLMHLGITHTIRDYGRENLYVYILDNGCHESVGGQNCSALEEKYPAVNEIIKITKDGKTPRVAIGFEENARNIISLLKDN